MTMEQFNEIGWRPGMSVVYKSKNVDSPTGESIRKTKVSRVEFTNDNGEGGGICGPIVKGTRVFVHYSQIIEVRTGFRCDGEENL